MTRSLTVMLACAVASTASHTAPAAVAAPQPNRKQPNVLFICVDDLRPQLRCYGHKQMVTPNFDRLAAQGRLFTRHYAQAPTCGASRYSMLTGLRPTGGQTLSNGAFVLLPRQQHDRPESMPHLFKRHGYATISIGKVSHQPDGHVFAYNGAGDGRLEMPFSWHEASVPTGKWGTGWNAFFAYADGSNRTDRIKAKKPIPPVQSAEVGDNGYPDGLIADAAIKKLGELKRDGKPFFLAVGFFKPHLPFTAPKKYWDLYDRAAIDLSPNPDRPKGAAPQSVHSSGEMFRYTHPKNARTAPDHHRLLRHAYYAAVSYADAQVGKVLRELDRLQLSGSTIVVVWGDHGWHLGDQSMWGKHTLFERSLRSAFIVRTPGMKSPGMPAHGIVESLDIYPTLAELCNLPAPNDLTGVSFAPLLADPNPPGKDGAFGYWRNGRSLRTDRYRLTRYPPRKNEKQPTIELYDHRTDPNETVNIAADHRRIVEQLMKQFDHNRPVLRDAD